ncbi:hypothetical protein [Schaalia cardiffensis]|uniref:hypothetical protein n=1 Tax=Schaalia cardiffensis TaxID=181487 RepID=UPI0023F15B08|nr:hypothetical protein [Schaalia cardiffensis]
MELHPTRAALALIAATTLAACTSNATAEQQSAEQAPTATTVNFDIRLTDTAPLVEYHNIDDEKCTRNPEAVPDIVIKNADGTIVANGTMNGIGTWDTNTMSCEAGGQVDDVPSSDFYTLQIAFNDGVSVEKVVKNDGTGTFTPSLSLSK